VTSCRSRGASSRDVCWSKRQRGNGVNKPEIDRWRLHLRMRAAIISRARSAAQNAAPTS